MTVWTVITRDRTYTFLDKHTWNAFVAGLDPGEYVDYFTDVTEPEHCELLKLWGGLA